MAAEVLTFDATRRRPLRRGAVNGSGDVLVFSGVRYERTEDRKTTDAPNASVSQTDPKGGNSGPRGRM